MPLAATGETAALGAILTGRFISLHTAAPPAGEVAVGAYARQAGTFVQRSGPDPTIYKNSTLLQFPTATASWGTITHFGIYSAVTAGTLVAFNTVTTSKAVAVDDIVRFEIDALSVSTD